MNESNSFLFYVFKGMPGVGEKGEPGKPGPRVSALKSLFISYCEVMFPFIPRITDSGGQTGGDWQGFSGFCLSSSKQLFRSPWK